MLDFTTLTSGLQALFVGAVSAALKLAMLWAAVQLAALFLPRYLRPLAVVGALALVLAFPVQLSRAGDALLARAGLVPQAGFVPAGFFAPAATAGIASQVQTALDSFVAFVTTQFGF